MNNDAGHKNPSSSSNPSMFLQIDTEVHQKLDNAHDPAASAELHTCLALLAFHMELDKRIDAMPDEITVRGFCSQKQAISWLFDGPRRNYLVPLEITQQQQLNGERLLFEAEQLGFITLSANKSVRFSSLELQRYFCAAHLFSQSFDKIPVRAASTYFPWLWAWWLEYDPHLIDKLIAATTVPSTEHVREYAIRVLALIGNPRAVEPLISLLHQTDLRSTAAYALAKFDDSRVIMPLIEAFKEPGFGQYFDLDMQSLGEEAFSALISSLRSDNALVRERAAASLGRFNDKRAVDPLIELLQDDNQEVQRGAIRGLGRLGDKRAIGHILSVMNTPADIVNWSVSTAIQRLEAKEAVPKLIRGLEFIISQGDKWKDSVSDIVWVLNGLDCPGDILEIMLSEPELTPLIQAADYVVDEQVIPPLQRQLEAAHQANDRKKAESLVFALGTLGDKQLVPMLLKWLPEYPKQVLRALADTQDNQYIDIFISYLTHPDRWVRSECMTALSRLHDEKAVEPLIHILQHDADNWIRSFAARALSQFISPLIVPALHHALKDTDAYVRIAAIKTLSDLRDFTALPLLEWLQQNDTERLDRGEAVWVIAELAIRNLQGDPIAARPLTKW